MTGESICPKTSREDSGSATKSEIPSAVGSREVAKAEADGHTIVLGNNQTHATNAFLLKEPGYDPIKDFTPVARVGELPFALAVHPSLPARTLAELLDYARAHPGKLSYATPNSTSLVAMESIKHIAKGVRNGETIITLDLRMYIGAEDPHDSVHIIGTPEIRLRTEGGVAGDKATAAVLVNSIETVMGAKPGLTTVSDIPAAHFVK